MSGISEVVLAPQRGDGRLTLLDVQFAVEGLPRIGGIELHFEECEDFESGAPGWLARELSGCVVTHYFSRTAWRIQAHWQAMHDRAAADYLAVEARALHRGA